MINAQERLIVPREGRRSVKSSKANKPKRSRFRPDRLGELMKERGLNQQDLAKFLKVDASQISRWLNAVNIPSTDAIAMMADFLQTSVDYLLDRVDDNTAYYQTPELSPDEWEFLLSIRDGSWEDALQKLVDEMRKKPDEPPTEGPKKT